MIGGDIAGFNGCTACTYNAAEGLRKLFDQLKPFGASDSPASGNDDFGINKVNGLLKRPDCLNNPCAYLSVGKFNAYPFDLCFVLRDKLSFFHDAGTNR